MHVPAVRSIIAIVILVSMLLLSAAGSSVATAEECEFVLGFQSLRDTISDEVGECLANVHYAVENGDGLQETTGGLLVWRKADNWTAFTDGYWTWINGPAGLQKRLNSERFSWEPDASSFAAASDRLNSQPAPSQQPAPAPAPVDQLTLNVVFVTSTVAPGGRVTLTAMTTPGATVVINVSRVSSSSDAQALGPRTANTAGYAGWTWTVSTTATQGTFPIEVTASKNGNTATARTQFTVVR